MATTMELRANIIAALNNGKALATQLTSSIDSGIQNSGLNHMENSSYIKKTREALASIGKKADDAITELSNGNAEANFKKIKKLVDEVNGGLGFLENQAKTIQGMSMDEFTRAFKDSFTDLNKLKGAFENARTALDKLNSAQDELITKRKDLANLQARKQMAGEYDSYQKDLRAQAKAQKSYNDYLKNARGGKGLTQGQLAALQSGKAAEMKKEGITSAQADAYNKRVQELQKATAAVNKYSAAVKGMSKDDRAAIESDLKLFKQLQEEIKELANIVNTISGKGSVDPDFVSSSKYKRYAADRQAVDDYNQAAQQAGLTAQLQGKDTQQIKAVIDDEYIRRIDRGKASMDGLSKGVQNVGTQINNTRVAADEFGDALRKSEDAARDSEMIESQMKYFFSAYNMIQMFRRAVTSAFNTVKELDAAMTEIAVVSEFSVSDMWEKLPEFTKQANQLGVSVKGAYEATTLYIQQGLDFRSSMALSTETLKMARIAGMDAAAATDAMTAALRGFNMELNETSGQRINDVYSKLAAITASNTQEISDAMSKTASIAHNANMEFENTAAFLSQIIETTRESAQTAGTALKFSA